MQNTKKKKLYSTPTLTIHGDVETLTLGNKGSGELDAYFPIGTPKHELTFSKVKKH